jgi:hypothetical protein
MDLYANKKIKISINALTGEETLLVSEKHLDNKLSNTRKVFFNTKFYSTKTKNSYQEDSYLSYIKPLNKLNLLVRFYPYLIKTNKKTKIKTKINL